MDGAWFTFIDWTELTSIPAFLRLQLKPEKVYFVGGFGVLSKWIPVDEYEVRC